MGESHVSTKVSGLDFPHFWAKIFVGTPSELNSPVILLPSGFVIVHTIRVLGDQGSNLHIRIVPSLCVTFHSIGIGKGFEGVIFPLHSNLSPEVELYIQVNSFFALSQSH